MLPAGEQLKLQAEIIKRGKPPGRGAPKDQNRAAEADAGVMKVSAQKILSAADEDDIHKEVSKEKASGLDSRDIPETTGIKLETAPQPPLDIRFPNPNQSRHCFTRHIEHNRCLMANGDDAPECHKFAKYYRSWCPGDWILRWNEQRANGTFPGPL